MTVWTELNQLSNAALGRRVVRLIGMTGAGLCFSAAAFAEHGEGRFLAGLFGAAFLLTVALPRTFGPRFGQFLLAAAVVIAFMAPGGGVQQGVTPLVWLAILPIFILAMLLSFPDRAISLMRLMAGSGR